MTDTSSDRGLGDDALRALASVLDEIIPASRDGRLPGAGQLGLAGDVEEGLRKSPQLRPVIDAGLEALAGILEQRGEPRLDALAPGSRLEAMNELVTAVPGFVPTLVFFTYAAYYQQDRVVAALGFEPRPPYPKGYELEPGDLSGLEAVRRRGPIFREV